MVREYFSERRWIFKCALSYALQRLGTPNMKLKPEHIAYISAVYNRRAAKSHGFSVSLTDLLLVSRSHRLAAQTHGFNISSRHAYSVGATIAGNEALLYVAMAGE